MIKAISETVYRVQNVDGRQRLVVHYNCMKDANGEKLVLVKKYHNLCYRALRKRRETGMQSRNRVHLPEGTTSMNPEDNQRPIGHHNEFPEKSGSKGYDCGCPGGRKLPDGQSV